MIAPPSQLLYRLSLACLLSLIVLTLSWELWLAPLRPNGSWLALKALPLLLPLRGMWRQNPYTMQWTAMLLLIYLAEGITRGYSESGLSAQLSWLEVVFSTVGFLNLLFYLRPLKQAQSNKLRKQII